MTDDNGLIVDKEMYESAQKWLMNNKSMEIGSGSYHSPRISSEIPDCSMPITADTYKFCQMACTYCFAYFMKMNNPSIKNSETGMQLQAVNAEKLIAALSGHPKDQRGAQMWRLFYQRKFLLHVGGLSDPFDGFEAKNGVGYEIMTALGDLNYPTLFSFKGPTIMHKKYVELFEKHAKQNNFAFQISMVTRDDKVAKYIEVGVPSPTKRLAAMKMLSDMGYWTILRLRPYIIGVTDESIDQLLEDALAAGAKGISMEFYALDSRATSEARKRYEWLGKAIGVKDLMSYFAKLSPSERGGYRRLNRLVKETHVKKIYKFCIEHGLTFGCSDPDFKELCTSGSCCSMPDNYPKNRLLENWTRQQLTYFLKEARKAYHKTGKISLFKFSEIYTNEPYFKEMQYLAGDHVSIIGLCEADRRALNYEKILRGYWNNLRSHANPCNYLHAKIVPCGIDENKDLVYKYAVHDYEQKWIDDGIDLTA